VWKAMSPATWFAGSYASHFSSPGFNYDHPTTVKLLIDLIYYQILLLASIWWMLSAGPLLGSATRRSQPAAGLPLELIEMIAAYSTYDKRSLRACTLTCYSWYIAVTPLLHQTLICPIYSPHKDSFRRPSLPFREEVFGLAPLVKTLWFRGNSTNRVALSLAWPHSCHILLPLYQFTRVNQLRIDYLDIPSFLPYILGYPTYFLPAVRSLALKEPKGTRREIIYFIGLFQHLQDLKLLYSENGHQEEPAGDLTLTPHFVPPLQGSLTMRHSTGVGLLKDMLDLFGDFRFRRMDLFKVDGTGLLLGACAKTLESVTLDPSDPIGEQLPLKSTHAPANDSAASRSPQDFDLSQNESLRTLKIPASFVSYYRQDTASLKRILSTITSSAFFEVVTLYGDYEFSGVRGCCSGRPSYHELSHYDRAREVGLHCLRFKKLREVHAVRAFQLVLCVSTSGCVGEHPVRILEEAVAAEKAIGGLCECFFPLVVYNPQGICDGY